MSSTKRYLIHHKYNMIIGNVYEIEIVFKNDTSDKYFYPHWSVGPIPQSEFDIIYKINAELIKKSEENEFLYDEFEIINVKCTKPNKNFDHLIKPNKKIKLIKGCYQYIDYILEGENVFTPRTYNQYVSGEMPIVKTNNLIYPNFLELGYDYLYQRMNIIRKEFIEKTCMTA